jgi:prepilin-type processing-associated H-X9-DG protein
MPITDEELIAYLLGDANPQQRQRVELGLANDPSLRARISELRMVLGQLDSLQIRYEPPADLLASTMARIDAASPTDAPTSSPSIPVTLAAALTNVTESRVRRSTWDSSALVLCSTVLLCLFLPTVLRARFESRKAQCAYRLQFLGRSLIEMALLDPHERFPTVAVEGPEAFSGVYASHLSSYGVVQSPSQVKCASLAGCRPPHAELEFIPTLAQLQSFDASQLEFFHRFAGGDFSYGLGVIDEGKIAAPRCEGRSNFPVIADSPMILNGREEFEAHDGRGLNIFFEDGHVAFIAAACLRDEIGDDPFCNLKQVHEVGLNKEDASLAPSHFGPLGNP